MDKKFEFKKISLPVEGMTCASCVARVEKALSKVDGIDDVSVNFATEKVSLSYNPDKVNEKIISSAVEDAGYKIDITSLQKTTKMEERIAPSKPNDFEKNLKKDFILSVILTIPVLVLNMGSMFDGFSQFISLPQESINKLLLILTTPVIFISGKRF
ncbi:MAG TPA: copper ion binding protein, partial [Ignavibacteriaceae bacterium]